MQPRQMSGIVAGTRTKSGATNFLRLHVIGDRDDGQTRKRAKKRQGRRRRPRKRSPGGVGAAYARRCKPGGGSRLGVSDRIPTGGSYNRGAWAASACLSDQVANQIAAGEVVERPASVVKELLENSLDAGATRIVIEVEARRPQADPHRRQRLRHGARRCAAGVRAACHLQAATSDDLLSIATLGFRGEALPSIASVARLSW